MKNWRDESTIASLAVRATISSSRPGYDHVAVYLLSVEGPRGGGRRRRRSCNGGKKPPSRMRPAGRIALDIGGIATTIGSRSAKDTDVNDDGCAMKVTQRVSSNGAAFCRCVSYA